MFSEHFYVKVFTVIQCAEINLQRNQRIAILSDCQAALKAISASDIKSLLVEECIGRLNSLLVCNRVHVLGAAA